jgi:hypothetical protein
MLCEKVVKPQLLEKEPLSAIPSAISSGIALATTEALATAEASSATADLSRHSPKGDDG